MVDKLVRNMVLLVAVWLATGMGLAHALGLGSVTVRSGLNQNLDASVELLAPTEDELRSLLVNMAGPDEFERLGIDYPYILGSLRFRVHRAEGSRPEIRIISSKPILDPYLRFLVEVETITGRFMREYTILLDPPGSPVARYEPASDPIQKSARTTQRSADAGSAGTMPAAGGAATGSYGPVKPGETLWSIASKTRPDDGISVQQMMLALVNANPDAFEGRNINSLKRGATLQIPALGDISSIGRSEALREAKRQVAQTPAAAPPRTQPTPEPRSSATPKPPAAGDSNFPQFTRAFREEVDGPTAKKPAAPGPSPVFHRDEQRLAELERELAASRQKEQNLRKQLENLEGSKKAQEGGAKGVSPEALVEDGVWQPEGEVTVPTVRSKRSELPGYGAPGTGQEPSRPIPDPVSPQAESTAPAVPQPAMPSPESSFGDDDPFANAQPAESEKPAAQPRAVAAPQPQPNPFANAQPASPAAPKQKPKGFPPRPTPVVLAPPKSKGFMDDIVDDTLADPMLTGLAGLGAVGLLSGLMLAVRRRQRNSEEAGEDDEDFLEIQESDEAGQIAGGAPTGDPLAIADMHLANGRTGDAVKALQMAMVEDPGNEEIKLKLLEIYERTSDKEGFDALTKAVHSQGIESQPRVWEHIKRMAEKLSPSGPVVTAGGAAAAAVGVAASAVASNEVPAQALDTQAMGVGGDELPDMLDLSDLGLDDDALGMPELASGDEDAGEVAGLGLDFDLDVDGGLTADDNSEASDFDLSDLGLPGDTLDASPAAADDEFDLSGLDLGSEVSLDDAASAAAPSLEQAASTDLDAGLDMGEDLGLNFDDAELGLGMGDETVVADSGDDDGLAFDATELGLDVPGSGPEATSDATQVIADADDDLGLGDFDLSGLTDDASTPATDQPAAGDDDGGLLDFSEDLDADGLDLGGGSLEELAAAGDDTSGSEPLALDTPGDDDLDLGLDDALGLDFSADADDAEDDLEAAFAPDDMGEPDDDAGTVLIDGLEMGAGKEDDLDLGDLGDLGAGDDGEVDTKLDLAKAYIDMGDPEGARDMLDEVLREGNDSQKQEAQGLIDGLV